MGEASDDAGSEEEDSDDAASEDASLANGSDAAFDYYEEVEAVEMVRPYGAVAAGPSEEGAARGAEYSLPFSLSQERHVEAGVGARHESAPRAPPSAAGAPSIKTPQTRAPSMVSTSGVRSVSVTRQPSTRQPPARQPPGRAPQSASTRATRPHPHPHPQTATGPTRAASGGSARRPAASGEVDAPPAR